MSQVVIFVFDESCFLDSLIENDPEFYETMVDCAARGGRLSGLRLDHAAEVARNWQASEEISPSNII